MSDNEFQTDKPDTEKVGRSYSAGIPRYDEKSTTCGSQMLS